MARGFLPRVVLGVVALVVAMLVAPPAAACPFCTTPRPSWSQQRESAAVVALGELSTSQGKRRTFHLHQALKGADRLKGLESVTVVLDLAPPQGALALLLASGPADSSLEQLSWTANGVDETSYVYFARAPSLRTPTAERLRYFARFLEHPDGQIAEDAYLEFGHAPYDEVAQVADRLPMDSLRGWLADPRVPPERKGFYGLALGLARGPAQRRENADFLRRLIVAPENDFRSGFDGVLGGYLMVAGKDALELIDQRYLSNRAAADGDVRHALTALRFYREFGHEIPAERLAGALRRLLARPEFSAAVIVDLARWQDWTALGEIAGLYARKQYAQAAIRRAIVGYLLACPTAAAAEELKRLRAADPKGVAEAEEVLSRLGSGPR